MQSKMDMRDLLEEETRAGLHGLCALLRETWHVSRKRRPSAMAVGDRLMELLASAEYAPPVASVAPPASAAASASTRSAQSSGSAVATAAPSDAATSSAGETPASAASSLVKSKVVACVRSTPADEWSLADAAKAARIEGAVQALGAVEPQDMVDFDTGEDTAELGGTQGMQRRRFLREVEPCQAFVASGGE